MSTHYLPIIFPSNRRREAVARQDQARYSAAIGMILLVSYDSRPAP